jgi:hypothetical protein
VTIESVTLMPISVGPDLRDARSVKDELIQSRIVFIGNHSPWLLAFDPVSAGLVASLNHPGGNVTGVSVILSALAAKQVGLLRGLNPGVTSIALLVNPDNRTTKPYVNDAQAA